MFRLFKLYFNIILTFVVASCVMLGGNLTTCGVLGIGGRIEKSFQTKSQSQIAREDKNLLHKRHAHVSAGDNGPCRSWGKGRPDVSQIPKFQAEQSQAFFRQQKLSRCNNKTQFTLATYRLPRICAHISTHTDAAVALFALQCLCTFISSQTDLPRHIRQNVEC